MPLSGVTCRSNSATRLFCLYARRWEDVLSEAQGKAPGRISVESGALPTIVPNWFDELLPLWQYLADKQRSYHTGAPVAAVAGIQARAGSFHAGRARNLRIIWPNGKEQPLIDLAVDRSHVVRQGYSVASEVDGGSLPARSLISRADTAKVPRVRSDLALATEKNHVE